MKDQDEPHNTVGVLRYNSSIYRESQIKQRVHIHQGATTSFKCGGSEEGKTSEITRRSKTFFRDTLKFLKYDGWQLQMH